MTTYIDRLQNKATTTQVLVFHHLLGMFTFFARRLLEELVESLQPNIIAVKVPCLFSRNITTNTDNWLSNLNCKIYVSRRLKMLTHLAKFYHNMHIINKCRYI